MKGKKMEGKKIVIERTGSVYIFQTNIIMNQEEWQKLRIEIMQQLKEGCVVLPAYVELVDVEQRLEALVE